MKEVFSIYRDNVEHSGTETLSVCIGNHHLGWAVTGQDGQNLQQLGWWGQGDTEEAGLQTVIQSSPALNRRYATTQLRFDAPWCTLIPAALYKESDAPAYLHALYGHTGSSHIQTEYIASWQLYLVYAVPQAGWDWARIHYPGATIRHSYSLALQRIESTAFEGALAVDIRSNEFSVIASRGNKLLLAQTYQYETPADVLYYLLKICQQFSLPQEQVRLSLTGLIDAESALYRELYQYFLELRFREANWRIPAVEEPVPTHFFTTLNDLAQCE